LFIFPEFVNADWRFEYKYRLTFQQYLCVRSAILPFMKKDRYSLAGEAGRYLVRSLYFDTDDLGNYQEKNNGDSDRNKLRIRNYSKTPQDGTSLRVELKARKGMSMEKHSTWINYDAYQEFMSTWHWPSQSDPVLNEFERYIHLKAQRPKIIVEYQREGYLCRGLEELRVTFDLKVKSARASSLFPEHSFFRPHYPGYIVLEIKCDKSQPDWLRVLVQQHGLHITPNSKYAQGIEVALPEIIRSSWSS
jgi:hypothetical protein